VQLRQGINFLGFRIFYHHKLLRKANIRKMRTKLQTCIQQASDYDLVYDSFQGWCAYAMHANSHKLRMHFGSVIQQNYFRAISSAEINKLIKFAEVS
jgi:hypothetical protein